jgi:Tol biopolymer transport system component
VQTETSAAIYVVEPGKEPRRVVGGSRREDGTLGMSWLPDGRIVFSSTASGAPQIWIVDGDGQNMRQLTSGNRPAMRPRASPDGRTIYFQCPSAEGLDLFRISPDGSGLEQLTRDGDAREVVVSPDGQTLYYTALNSGTPRLMKLAAGGGAPVSLSNGYFRAHDVWPDGTKLLGIGWNESARRSLLATLTVATGAIEFLPDVPPSALMMPDGRVSVIVRRKGEGFVMTRALNGDDPLTLAAFGTDNIFGGAVTRDGRIAVSRGTSSSDVVLIRAK